MKIIINLKPGMQIKFEVLRRLVDLIDDPEDVYNIEVNENEIKIEKSNPNKRDIKAILYDITLLNERKMYNQITSAIAIAYMYTFEKTNDLRERISTLRLNPDAEIYEGSKHAFYKDTTGKYPEDKIIKEIERLMPNIVKERQTRINR